MEESEWYKRPFEPKSHDFPRAFLKADGRIQQQLVRIPFESNYAYAVHISVDTPSEGQ